MPEVVNLTDQSSSVVFLKSRPPKAGDVYQEGENSEVKLALPSSPVSTRSFLSESNHTNLCSTGFGVCPPPSHKPPPGRVRFRLHRAQTGAENQTHKTSTQPTAMKSSIHVPQCPLLQKALPGQNVCLPSPAPARPAILGSTTWVLLFHPRGLACLPPPLDCELLEGRDSVFLSPCKKHEHFHTAALQVTNKYLGRVLLRALAWVNGREWYHSRN